MTFIINIYIARKDWRVIEFEIVLRTRSKKKIISRSRITYKTSLLCVVFLVELKIKGNNRKQKIWTADGKFALREFELICWAYKVTVRIYLYSMNSIPTRKRLFWPLTLCVHLSCVASRFAYKHTLKRVRSSISRYTAALFPVWNCVKFKCENKLEDAVVTFVLVCNSLSLAFGYTYHARSSVWVRVRVRVLKPFEVSK